MGGSNSTPGKADVPAREFAPDEKTLISERTKILGGRCCG